jgi:ApbE superfamily uncharacterized protein (UPF0280 family)
MYHPRLYRERMGLNRFCFFTVCYLETDLWIGVDKDSYREEMKDFTLKKIIELRKALDKYAGKNIEFMRTLTPVEINRDAPGIAREMAGASIISGSGPMAAVAGAFSQFIGESITSEYKVNELAVENGGDCYIRIKKPLNVSVYAGQSPFSERIGITITPEYSPLGICTSSGTVGHSRSFGKADAVMVVCKNTLLADAYATVFCNKIRKKSDIELTLAEIKLKKSILGTVIIFKEKVGITGRFKLQLFN